MLKLVVRRNSRKLLKNDNIGQVSGFLARRGFVSWGERATIDENCLKQFAFDDASRRVSMSTSKGFSFIPNSVLFSLQLRRRRPPPGNKTFYIHDYLLSCRRKQGRECRISHFWRRPSPAEKGCNLIMGLGDQTVIYYRTFSDYLELLRHFVPLNVFLWWSRYRQASESCWWLLPPRRNR